MMNWGVGGSTDGHQKIAESSDSLSARPVSSSRARMFWEISTSSNLRQLICSLYCSRRQQSVSGPGATGWIALAIPCSLRSKCVRHFWIWHCRPAPDETRCSTGVASSCKWPYTSKGRDVVKFDWWYFRRSAPCKAVTTRQIAPQLTLTY